MHHPGRRAARLLYGGMGNNRWSIRGPTMRTLPVNQRARILLVQAGAVILAPIFFLVQPAWDDAIHEVVEIVGVGLVLACVAGRMWSILYVGAKKNHELVTEGPYSISRNPLYLSSTIGAVGVGLIYGSLAVALALGLLAYLVFIITATKESEYLWTVFGDRYEAYARQTPMFWPKPSLYRDEREVTFSPKALKRTLLDGLLFLAAFPLIETLEYLQAAGHLPILMRIF